MKFAQRRQFPGCLGKLYVTIRCKRVSNLVIHGIEGLASLSYKWDPMLCAANNGHNDQL